MIKPNFFIVGTPKGGTTSLFNYMDYHPEIFIPKIKEPHFFSYQEVENTYYRTNIIKDKEEYLDLYKDVFHEKAIGDLSTSYFYHYKSASRIKVFNPDAKIIVVIRNPIDRAISHYLMDYNLGYINSSLKEVIKNENKYQRYYDQYINTGFYEKSMEKFFDIFDRVDVLIVLSDDLFLKTEKTLYNIFNFIGVNPDFKPNLTRVFNQYKRPKYKFLKKALQSQKIKEIIKVFPESIIEKLKPLIFDKNIKKPKFDEERILLEEIYLKSINNTEYLINKSLANWKIKFKAEK